MTELRWYKPLEGPRILQQDTYFGWRDVDEVSEADEIEEQERRTRDAITQVLHARQRVELEALNPAHKRPPPDEPEFTWTGRRW